MYIFTTMIIYTAANAQLACHVTHPRRQVSSSAEDATQHGEIECSEKEDERQEEDVGHVRTVAAVALEDPVPGNTVFRQKAAGADEHLVLCRVAVIIQPRPVTAERRLERRFEIALVIFVPAVRRIADLQRSVHLCTTTTNNNEALAKSKST